MFLFLLLSISEEAENERMHLLTALQLKEPSLVFRLAVIGAQGIKREREGESKRARGGRQMGIDTQLELRGRKREREGQVSRL